MSGLPSMATYAGMTPRAPASRTAISNGAKKTSVSSRRPTWTGATLRPPSLKEYPA